MVDTSAINQFLVAALNKSFTFVTYGLGLQLMIVFIVKLICPSFSQLIDRLVGWSIKC